MSHVFDHFRHFGVQRPGIGYRKVPNDTENTEGYRRKPKNTEGYRRIPRDTEGHRRTPKDPEGCRRIPKGAEGCRRMPRRSSNMQAASQVFNPLSLFPFHAKPGSDTPLAPKTGPRRAQEGSKSGFNFFFRLLGRQGRKKGGSKRGLKRKRSHKDVEGETILSKKCVIVAKKLPKCFPGRPKAPPRPSEL